MYTTKSFAVNDYILPEPYAPSITICDPNLSPLDFRSWNFDDYVWEGEGVAEFECEEVSENIIPFAMSNRHSVSFLQYYEAMGLLYYSLLI